MLRLCSAARAALETARTKPSWQPRPPLDSLQPADCPPMCPSTANRGRICYGCFSLVCSDDPLREATPLAARQPGSESSGGRHAIPAQTLARLKPAAYAVSVSFGHLHGLALELRSYRPNHSPLEISPLL